MSRLVVRHGVFARGPFRGGLGEESSADQAAPVEAAVEAAATSADLAKLDERTRMIMARLDEDARTRRIALYIGAASALFAAVKLGLIAFPAIRSRVGR